MYFKIKGDCFSDNITKDMQAITNYGILHLNEVKYDEANKMISIPIERCKIKAIKKIFLGTTTSFEYDKNTKIPALIVIKNIINCKIENNFDNPNVSTIHILLGLQLNMKEKEICIGSAEEDRGKTLYSIELKVNELDIEISDQRS